MARLSEQEIERRMQGASGWRLLPGGEIEREWKLSDFDAAIAFVNAVAGLAQEADHHPDIRVHGWNKVALTLSTHSQGGLTDADFRLAERIDALEP